MTKDGALIRLLREMQIRRDNFQRINPAKRENNLKQGPETTSHPTNQNIQGFLILQIICSGPP